MYKIFAIAASNQRQRRHFNKTNCLKHSIDTPVVDAISILRVGFHFWIELLVAGTQTIAPIAGDEFARASELDHWTNV